VQAQTPASADADALSHSWELVFERLAAHSGFILIAGGLVFIAYLINRFAPEKRKRIRRVVLLFFAYLVGAVLSATLHVLGPVRVWEAFHLAENLLEALTIINLGALAVFDLGLPLLKVDLLSLTSDILVGLAYLAALVLLLLNSGINPAGVLGASAVVSAVLALSLQSTLGNILGGVALQLDGSIHVGDWIQLDNGRQGKVKEIRWRHTSVETRDWDTIIVPNATLLAQNIIILGKREGAPVEHRMWVYFNIDFRYAPSLVIQAVTEALLASPIPNVAADPKPNCICYDLAKDTRDSFAYYAVRYWLTDLAVDDPTSSLVRARIYAALRRAGIPLARPISTILHGPLDDEDDLAVARRHREKRVHALTSIPLFKALTPSELDYLADHVRYAPFVAGELMTRQGAVAHWLYVVMAGTCDVRLETSRGPSKTLATITAPSFFGEMGLMTGEPRANDVFAVTDVECYRLDKDGFEKVLLARPEIAEDMSHTLAARRVELIAARDDLDEAAKSSRQISEQERIYRRIKDYFGLSG
jgi:small-conductance mechanosensitive channel/CRP-like cAMP-binding protein